MHVHVHPPGASPRIGWIPQRGVDTSTTAATVTTHTYATRLCTSNLEVMGRGAGAGGLVLSVEQVALLGNQGKM